MVVVLRFLVNLNGVHQLQAVRDHQPVQVYQVHKQYVLLDMIGKRKVSMPQLREINMESMICPVEPGNT